MAETTYLPGTEVANRIRVGGSTATARHSLTVRITHWLTTISFLALAVSGFAIILAHPRFYWGETGGLGTASLFDLPLPFMLGGPSGWGRYMHFEAAWLGVLTGVFYAVYGVASGHFRKNLWPSKGQLKAGALRREAASRLQFRKPPEEGAQSYNALQRLSYIAVVFGLFPLMIWTGLAMSPAIVSVFPFFVTALGGQETARTMHFFGAVALVLFLLVHIAMVIRAGFVRRTKAMIMNVRSGSVAEGLRGA